jgi:hypothetical protein
VDDRLDLDIQRREAIEAELGRRALAHKRRVARLKRGARLRAQTNKAATQQPLISSRSATRGSIMRWMAMRHPLAVWQSSLSSRNLAVRRGKRLGERASSLPGGIHRAGAKAPEGAAGAFLGIGFSSVLSVPFNATFLEVTGRDRTVFLPS